MTRDLHESTERAFGHFDLRNADGYGAFLVAQAGAFLPLEAWLDASKIETALPDWPARRRALLLRHDLDDLGVPVPAESTGSPRVVGAPLGVAYVLEGSRHGARVLVRLAGSSPDPRVVAATRFLGQSAPPGSWSSLLAAIEREGVTPARHAAIVDGAKYAFELFHRSAVRAADGSTAAIR